MNAVSTSALFVLTWFIEYQEKQQKHAVLAQKVVASVKLRTFGFGVGGKGLKDKLTWFPLGGTRSGCSG